MEGTDRRMTRRATGQSRQMYRWINSVFIMKKKMWVEAMRGEKTWRFSLGKLREKQLFTSWRIDCHYDSQLLHSDTMVTGLRLEIWLANPAGWDEILRLSEDQGKLCWGRGVNWSVTPFPDLNDVSDKWESLFSLSLAPLLCINLCLEVTDSENSIRSVSSHQYLSHSRA